jgi:hypothetical protein
MLVLGREIGKTLWETAAILDARHSSCPLGVPVMVELRHYGFLLAMREYFTVHGFGLLGLDCSSRQQSWVQGGMSHGEILERLCPPS